MPVLDLNEWIDEWAVPGTLWFVKRLSGNDTLANGSHQYGTFVPKEVMFPIFPQINTKTKQNPDTPLDLYLDSHADFKKTRLTYYNNHFFRTKEEIEAKKSKRNETRITKLGGSQSALLNAESTGALAVFVFVLDQQGHGKECHVWVCDDQLEEEVFEADLGPVEPKQYIVWKPGSVVTGVTSYLALVAPAGPKPCKLTPADIPTEWLKKFPTGEEIVAKTKELRPDTTLPVDKRILIRRACEFEVFKSVEEAYYTPKVMKGFGNFQDFLSLAQTILQSRKSRGGKSLEFHARDIFKEELLVSGTHFSHQPTTEGKRKPDFIFPSAKAYHDPKFPANQLRMLATKTTLRDRWRQITKEAGRIEEKHLLTVQDGISENQFKEICEEKVKLVVPKELHKKYPKPVRPHLVSLESFIAEVRLLKV
jgi:hypothetical protein